MILLSHSGKQHSYQTAKALFKLGQLDTFYTSSYVTNTWLQQYFLNSGNSYYTRRFIEELPGSKVNANWRFEVKENIYRKFYGNTHKALKAVYHRDINFDNYIAKKLIIQKPSTFWGFQGSCLKSLIKAQSLGWDTIYEQTATYLGYYKNILQEEKKLNPEWADSIDSVDYPIYYEKRLLEEPTRARNIVVASEFSKQSLLKSGFSSSNIHVLPLGADLSNITYNPVKKGITSRPLKVLFVGRITQGKGVKYLLDAIKYLDTKDYELTIIGNLQGNGKQLENYKGCYNHITGISQSELFKKYQEYDVLVNPSLTEGFGFVIIEALAAGLPVVTTSNSIGPDVIVHDKNGYIVPIRDSNAIIEMLTKLRNKDDDDFQKMRLFSRQSSSYYSWENYGHRLEVFLNKIS